MKIIGVAFFLCLWAIISYGGIASDVFIPTPHATLLQLVDFALDGSFYAHLGATLWRCLAGLLLAIVIGVPIGLALGNSRWFYDSFGLTLDFFRSIPATAIFPLALLLLGIGDAAKIGIVAYSTGLIMVLQTYYGVVNASPLRRQVLDVMGATSRQRFRHLLLMEALPYIFAGIRVAASLSLILVIVTEMFIGTTHGLGKLLIDSQSVYAIESLYAAIIATGLIGYAINQLSTWVEQSVIHWRTQ